MHNSETGDILTCLGESAGRGLFIRSFHHFYLRNYRYFPLRTVPNVPIIRPNPAITHRTVDNPSLIKNVTVVNSSVPTPHETRGNGQQRFSTFLIKRAQRSDGCKDEDHYAQHASTIGINGRVTLRLSNRSSTSSRESGRIMRRVVSHLSHI